MAWFNETSAGPACPRLKVFMSINATKPILHDSQPTAVEFDLASWTAQDEAANYHFPVFQLQKDTKDHSAGWH